MLLKCLDCFHLHTPFQSPALFIVNAVLVCVCVCFSGLRNILPITTAKVPIVKFEHKQSSLEGDISLYNTLVSSHRLLPISVPTPYSISSTLKGSNVGNRIWDWMRSHMSPSTICCGRVPNHTPCSPCIVFKTGLCVCVRARER